MGDPAPARSLDDIDLSALRVSAPPPPPPLPRPSLARFPSPPLESGWPHASRASRASGPPRRPPPLSLAPALRSPSLSTRCRFWEPARSPPWGAPPPFLSPPLPLLSFRTPSSQVFAGHPPVPLNLQYLYRGAPSWPLIPFGASFPPVAPLSSSPASCFPAPRILTLPLPRQPPPHHPLSSSPSPELHLFAGRHFSLPSRAAHLLPPPSPRCSAAARPGAFVRVSGAAVRHQAFPVSGSPAYYITNSAAEQWGWEESQVHRGRRGRVSGLQKLWPGLGRGCLQVCTHTNTCSMWSFGFGKAWVFMALLEGGGGDGDLSREGLIRKGIRGEQLQQEFLGNTYSLSLLGPLHVLIWELSAAFTCFSSAGSPGLRGH